MHPSQQHAYPVYPPHPLRQHAYPPYPHHPSQHRRPPAHLRHLPPSYAVTEEANSEVAYADDYYPGAYPDFPPREGTYPPPSPPFAGEFDYHRSVIPPPQYPLDTAAYSVLGVLPPHGQYPGMQPPMYQSYVQPPILQLPVYSIGHIYPPQYPPQYLPSFQSLYQPQPTVEQQLLHYTELPTPVDSTCPGLLELATKQNDESEAGASSTLPSHTLSLADTTRKLDQILGKRADQRTEEEKEFREYHLAARQSVYTRDAIDRDRRRQRKLLP
jgi:hypothetical protein